MSYWRMVTLIWVWAGRSHSVVCTHLPPGVWVRYETQVGWAPKPMVPTVCSVRSTGWPAWCPDAKSTVGGLERRNAIAVKTTSPMAMANNTETMAILADMLAHPRYPLLVSAARTSVRDQRSRRLRHYGPELAPSS